MKLILLFNFPELAFGAPLELAHMIVCHCHGLTDRALRSAIRDGAITCERLMERTDAGTCCGGCRPALDELIGEERLLARGSARRSSRVFERVVVSDRV
jgi:bacterioferritin-associated ferredoxin